jgi:hypothetical protein
LGTKYSSQSTSGYNSSPPVDDGTASEANKVKWSTIKTKLADVLKTFGEAINTALVTALDTSPRAITASDSAASTDHWKTIQVTTSSVTVTLANATTMAAGYIVNVANQSSGDITVALATSTDTIDGVTNTTQTISAKQCREYIVNAAATGYITKSERNVAASQAEMEAATSTNVPVTPGRLHYHPASPKALIIMTDLGGSPPTATAVYNTLGSLTPAQNAAGDHTLTWTNSLTNPMVLAFVQSDATTVPRAIALRNGSPAATSARLLTSAFDGTLTNPTAIYLWIYGDLA